MQIGYKPSINMSRAAMHTVAGFCDRKAGHWSHTAVITVSNAPKIDPNAEEKASLLMHGIWNRIIFTKPGINSCPNPKVLESFTMVVILT